MINLVLLLIEIIDMKEASNIAKDAMNIPIMKVNMRSNMNKFLQDVQEFNNKFHLTELQNKEPGFIEIDMMKFRIKFMMEELQEFANASGFTIDGDKVNYNANSRKDLEKALDGLVDLLYVLKGTVLLMGMGHIFDTAWQRVQDANMQKIRAQHKDESKRGAVWDVVKPEGWIAPSFSDLVNIQKTY